MREINQFIAVVVLAICLKHLNGSPIDLAKSNDTTTLNVQENPEPPVHPETPSHLRVYTEGGTIGESKIKPRKGVSQNITATSSEIVDITSTEEVHVVDDKPILVNTTTTKMTSQLEIKKEEDAADNVKKVSDPTTPIKEVKNTLVAKSNTTVDNKSTTTGVITKPVVELVEENKAVPDSSISPVPITVLNTTSTTKQSTSSTVGTSKITASPSTTTTTTTTTSTTTTTTTTTTTSKPTTKEPKKPTITYSVEDVPSLLDLSKTPNKITSSTSGKLSVDEPEQPIAQPSQELIMDSSHVGGHGDIVIPVVALIFAVPMLLGIVTVLFRRVRDYWSTRHYRRMDFLVDGMYNY